MGWEVEDYLQLLHRTVSGGHPPNGATVTPMGTAYARERRLRSDAERNRTRILAAAAEIFAADGLDASLEAIAASAGVGIGTLYRRFGDRDGLIDALFEERISAAAAIAQRALDYEDAWEGLEYFLRESSALHVADRGLREAMLSPQRGRERAARARQKVAPLAAQVLDRARDDGRVRQDLDVYDLPVFQLMLGTIGDIAGDVAPALWQRFLVILLDGMQASRTAPTPLPCGPLDARRYAATTAGRQPNLAAVVRDRQARPAGRTPHGTED